MKLIRSVAGFALKSAKASVIASGKFVEVLTEDRLLDIETIQSIMGYIVEESKVNEMTQLQRSTWFQGYVGLCVVFIVAVPEDDYERAKQCVQETLLQVKHDFDIPNIAEMAELNGDVNIFDVPGHLIWSYRSGRKTLKLAKDAGIGYGFDYLAFQAGAMARMGRHYFDLAQAQMTVMFYDVPEHDENVLEAGEIVESIQGAFQH